MAIVECPKCSTQISDKAKECPKCGYRIKNSKKTMFIKVIFLVVVLLLIGMVGFKFISEKIHGRVIEKTYNELKRVEAIYGLKVDDLNEPYTISAKLFGIDGTVVFDAVAGLYANTAYWSPEDQNAEEKIVQYMIEMYGEDYDIFPYDYGDGYGWKNKDGFTAIALQQIPDKNDGKKILVVYQNMEVNNWGSN